MVNAPHPRAFAWLAAGLLLALGSLAAAWLAGDFAYGSPMDSRPILPFTALMVALGFVYCAHGSASGVLNLPPGRWLPWWVFGVGALMRLFLSLSQPVLEDDWYRYLWDGAVTAHGFNPYAATPQMVRDGEAPHLEGLAAEAGVVLDRINHPELGTVYPPLAQAAFAIAHWIAPWRLSGLRVLYFAVDCGVFALLLALLRCIGRPPLYAALYWWNPLAIKECYNSVHMDLLVVPLVLGALLLLFRQRAVWAAALLALAAAVKVWPVLLLLPILAAQWRSPRKMLASGVAFTAAAALLFAPLVTAMALGNRSGFIAYSQRWEMNDALFMVFPWLVEHAGMLVGFDPTAGASHRAGRIIAALIVLAAAMFCAFRTARDPHAYHWSTTTGRRGMAGLWCAITATLFLVSPTQYPWYYLWLLPLVALVPRPSLLLLTAMLPLYYLKFYLEARGQADFFHYRIVWLEYAPVWALLLWEWRRAKKQHGNPPGP